MWWGLKHKQQKMPNARANINVYSSTRISGLMFKNEMICIPRTARYVMGIKAQTTEGAKRTDEHQRIQQYAIFRFNFWRWNDMYTTNCQVCDGNWSINGRRCRTHERTSTYTAVRDFPINFLKMKWYVYHELPGMWYEIKQKQQKEDAESTGEHQRIQQYAMFRFFPDFVVFDGFI